MPESSVELRLTPGQAAAAQTDALPSSSGRPTQSAADCPFTPQHISGRTVAGEGPGASGLDVALFMPPHLTPRQVQSWLYGLCNKQASLLMCSQVMCETAAWLGKQPASQGEELWC